MSAVILGSEAIAGGGLTRGQLRWNYRPIHRDVYVPRDSPISLLDRIHAAWLWSGRRGVITGRAASSFHGAKWVDEVTPVDLLGLLHHPPVGIVVHRERIGDDVIHRGGLPVATIARTAFDLARHLPRTPAVIHLDALARATRVTAEDVEPLIAGNRGARGVRRCRSVLATMDGGAESPKESWLRLLLIDDGLPPPVTQIRVSGGGLAYLDMGWEEPMVAVEYDGDHHRTNRRQYAKDVRRAEMLRDLGWWVIRVIKEDHPALIVNRVRNALARRSAPRLPPGLRSSA